jgi:hypothetical protein
MKSRLLVALLVVGSTLVGTLAAQKLPIVGREPDVEDPATKGYSPAPSPFGPEAVGGPDGFGYRFIDSAEPGGPAFAFADISGTGTGLGLSDDGHANVTLPFTFPFYGVGYTGVRVGNNGALLLGTTGTVNFTNVCPLPSTAGATEPRLSVFWDDIDSDTGNVFHQSFANCPVTSGGTGQCFIVQWHNRPHFSNIGSATFQAVLYAGTGNIVYQYLDTDFGDAAFNAGASASIGIENEAISPSYFLSYSCNQVGAAPNNRAILWTPPPFRPGAASITAESCAPGNGALDPGETVTVSLCVQAVGVSTTNLVGTLQATGGVENPSAAQTYGAIAAGGPAVCRDFTFNVDLALACGANVVATLALQDGATAYPPQTFTFTTGTIVLNPPVNFANPAAITIPTLGTAVPYPSTIAAAGLVGTVQDVNVTLTGFSHTFPDDLGVLLVGPTGASLEIASGPNGGTDAVALNLTLDDQAGTQLPVSAALASGSFRPMTEYNDLFSPPAPAVIGQASPFGAATLASIFNNTAPNGNWNLFVLDFVGGDGGSISGGWALSITTGQRVCCTGACAVTAPSVTVPNDPGLCSAVVSYPRPTVAGICGLVTCAPPSGSVFPVGANPLTCDPEAPGPNGVGTITVQDVEAPVLAACPADIVIDDAPPTPRRERPTTARRRSTASRRPGLPSRSERRRRSSARRPTPAATPTAAASTSRSRRCC